MMRPYQPKLLDEQRTEEVVVCKERMIYIRTHTHRVSVEKRFIYIICNSLYGASFVARGFFLRPILFILNGRIRRIQLLFVS